MKIMRQCFTVLLIGALIIQDPAVSKASNVKLLKEQNVIYSLTDEIVQKAQIDDLNECQIQYYLNGGTNAWKNPLLFEQSDLPVRLETPTRSGYNFAGWYADSKYKHKITEITEMENLTLYAKWTKPIDGYYNVQMYSYQSSPTKNRINKKLKNCTYDFLTDIDIPGMPDTREKDIAEKRITDTSVCPQGICLTDDFYLVSAYATNRNGTLGCIHVFDKETGEYLVTMGMNEESHLGGLAFDGENIWVCHSNTRTLECIPYAFVKRIASRKSQTVVDCTAWFEEFRVENSPSCITFHDGRIYVATHTKVLNSVMIAYKPTENGLKRVSAYRIPDKVQGIAFDDKGRVYLSTSYGRQCSSYLKIYDSLERMDKKPNHPITKVEMPPCSEEIDIKNDQLYIVFESASEKYFEGTDGKGTSISPIDQIMTVSKSSIFQ